VSVIDADQPTVFAIIAPIDLTLIFTGFGVLPAVTGVRDYPGHWDAAGLARTPVFSDRSTAHETLLQYEPPARFSYEITGFTNIFGRIVSKAHGEWIFTPVEPGKTRVEWTYTFTPLQGRRLLLQYCILPLWKRYMQKALRLAGDEVMRRVRNPV
jgi:hypothetical protein